MIVNLLIVGLIEGFFGILCIIKPFLFYPGSNSTGVLASKVVGALQACIGYNCLRTAVIYSNGSSESVAIAAGMLPYQYLIGFMLLSRTLKYYQVDGPQINTKWGNSAKGALAVVIHIALGIAMTFYITENNTNYYTEFICVIITCIVLCFVSACSDMAPEPGNPYYEYYKREVPSLLNPQREP